MAGKVLRRCSLCKRYHVSYIVTDPITGSKAYYCYDCWKALQANQPGGDLKPGGEKSVDAGENTRQSETSAE